MRFFDFLSLKFLVLVGVMYLHFKRLYLKRFDFEKVMVNVAINIDDANVCFNFFLLFLSKTRFWGHFTVHCFFPIQNPLELGVFLSI